MSARRRTQGRLERQEDRPEAVFGARRSVRRPSWVPGGPSGAPSEGRLGCQEAENVGFADSSSENIGFADSSSENAGFADSSSENIGFA